MEQIRTYWASLVTAQSYEDYHAAEAAYLEATGRETPASGWGGYGTNVLQQAADQARREDGDQTIWSDPYPWWQENEPDLSWLEAYRTRRDKT